MFWVSIRVGVKQQGPESADEDQIQRRRLHPTPKRTQTKLPRKTSKRNNQGSCTFALKGPSPSEKGCPLHASANAVTTSFVSWLLRKLRERMVAASVRNGMMAARPLLPR
eukprot:EG_transcript_41450